MSCLCLLLGNNAWNILRSVLSLPQTTLSILILIDLNVLSALTDTTTIKQLVAVLSAPMKLKDAQYAQTILSALNARMEPSLMQLESLACSHLKTVLSTSQKV